MVRWSVQAVSDLCQLQSALVRSWRGTAREVEGLRPFVSADRKDKPMAGYRRNVYGWTDSTDDHLVRQGLWDMYVRMCVCRFDP